jgi:Uma2 family endonuclease
MSTDVAVVTPEDLLRMGDAGKGYELANGELKEIKMSARSSRVGGLVYWKLQEYCETQSPGWAFPPETGFRCFAEEPGQVRKPDAAYIKSDRYSRTEFEEDGWIEVVPDLVVEVVSPNDNAEELQNKIEEWLNAGVKLLWVVYPSTRQILTYRLDGSTTLFRSTDALTAPEVLPGFSCPVADFFRLPGEPVPAA